MVPWLSLKLSQSRSGAEFSIGQTHPARGKHFFLSWNYFSAMRTSLPETMVCCGGCHLFRRARTAKRRITVLIEFSSTRNDKFMYPDNSEDL